MDDLRENIRQLHAKIDPLYLREIKAKGDLIDENNDLIEGRDGDENSRRIKGFKELTEEAKKRIESLKKELEALNQVRDAKYAAGLKKAVNEAINEQKKAIASHEKRIKGLTDTNSKEEKNIAGIVGKLGANTIDDLLYDEENWPWLVGKLETRQIITALIEAPTQAAWAERIPPAKLLEVRKENPKAFKLLDGRLTAKQLAGLFQLEKQAIIGTVKAGVVSGFEAKKLNLDLPEDMDLSHYSQNDVMDWIMDETDETLEKSMYKSPTGLVKLDQNRKKTILGGVMTFLLGFLGGEPSEDTTERMLNDREQHIGFDNNTGTAEAKLTPRVTYEEYFETFNKDNHLSGDQAIKPTKEQEKKHVSKIKAEKDFKELLNKKNKANEKK
ncbi:hypothetical protein HY224_03180 [Candidatus Uhrbacteria bacterium]|nr:hypothetical protein [Candidatus Uhrbacteria bacterium]